MGGWLRVFDFIFAARPLLHIPVWSVYLMSLHYHHRLSGEHFDWGNLLMLFCLSLMAAGAYFINQVYDYESDMVNRKLGFLQQGLVTDSQLCVAFLITSILALALTPLFSLLIFMIFAQGFFLAFAYSAPPLRLKDRAVWGIVANGWSIGFLTSITVMPKMTIHTAGLLGWDSPIYFLLTVMAVSVLTTIPDMAGDRASKTRTVAVILGQTGAVVIALVCSVLAAGVAFRSDQFILAALAAVAAVLTVAALVLRSDRSVLFAAKAPILLLTLTAAYFYPPYLLFIIVLVVATRIYYRKRFDMVYPRLA